MEVVMSKFDLRQSLKPKDLVRESCEEYESPFLVSSNGMIYGYIVIDNYDDYALSYYNLFGGETLKEDNFDTVEDAQLFAQSHHNKVMNEMLRHHWEVA